MGREVIDQAKSVDELVRRASFEQAGDQLLWLRKFGRTGILAANTPEDVWEQGGTKILPYTAGEKLSVVSASAADTLGGTGANYIQVSGLDVNYNLVTDTIIMNGTTPVVSTSDFITVHRARAVFCGTGLTNAGKLTITGVSSTSVHASIPASESITHMSHFTVPAGYTLFTLDTSISVYRSSGANASRGAEIDQYVYVPDANTTFRTIRVGVNSSSSYVATPQLIANTPEKSTLWYKATADTNNTVVSTSVSYLLAKGDYNLRTEL